MLMLHVVTLSVLINVNVRMVLQGMVSTAMVRFLEQSNLEFLLKSNIPKSLCSSAFLPTHTLQALVKSFTTTE